MYHVDRMIKRHLSNLGQLPVGVHREQDQRHECQQIETNSKEPLEPVWKRSGNLSIPLCILQSVQGVRFATKICLRQTRYRNGNGKSTHDLACAILNANHMGDCTPLIVDKFNFFSWAMCVQVVQHCVPILSQRHVHFFPVQAHKNVNEQVDSTSI